MRHIKTPTIVAAFMVLAVLLGLAGCGDDHNRRIRSDRNHSVYRNERHDGAQYRDRGRDSHNDRWEHHGR